MSATRYVDLPSPFRMKRGGTLAGARVAYETWGTLSPTHGNAVLILTGLSPSAHAASNADDRSPGWWEDVIGPGKPIDTDRWFVVCVNSLGSCKGSTGPASPDPATGKPYRMRFPELSLEDVARGAKHVLDALGVAQLKCLVGPSMGGMSAQAFALQFPEMAPNAMLISTSPQALPFSIGIRSLQREAILRDPKFRGGDYTDDALPRDGLAIARKLGVVTYRSALEWKQRFGRARVDPPPQQAFGREFQIESYLEGHAQRFVGSFDPCSYIYLSRAMDWFDLADYGGTVEAGLARMAMRRALVIGVESDILFPLEQQEQIAEGLRTAGAAVEFSALPSIQGHDAFLVDFRRFNPVIAKFMSSLH
jgi:homoserine O-acetyltransferase/O-succinyltransferase